MFNSKYALCTAAAASMLVVSTAAFAFSDMHDSVFDERENHVTDMRGNCVLTKWENGHHPCNGPRLTEEHRTVYFGFDSYKLASQARDKLDYIARIAVSSPKPVTVEIVGHADHLGSADYNKRLSQKRAKAVKNYLMGQGLAKVRVAKLDAMGENQPTAKGCEGKAPAEMKKCLMADRRVEIRFHYE